MKITDIFSGTRRKLIEQRKEIVEQNSQAAELRLAEIEALKQDPDFQIYQSAMRVAAKIKQLESAHRDALATEREKVAVIDAEISGAQDEKVTAFLNWVEAEKRRASREIVSRGSLEQTRIGTWQGRLTSNADKIAAYLKALDEAAAKAKLGEMDLNDIRAQIPIFDASTTEQECPASIAFALQ